MDIEKCPYCRLETECEDFMEEHIFTHFYDMGIIERIRCNLVNILSFLKRK